MTQKSFRDLYALELAQASSSTPAKLHPDTVEQVNRGNSLKNMLETLKVSRKQTYLRIFTFTYKRAKHWTVSRSRTHP
jgi:hypothetical protein